MFDFIITFFIAAAILAAVMALSVAITLPFAGALVRWRANYNPLAVGLDQESRQAHIISSFMWRGWQGGLILTIVSDQHLPLSLGQWNASRDLKAGKDCGKVGDSLLTSSAQLKIMRVGMYPTLMYSTLLSVLSIVFVGGSATKGPKNAYSVPEAGGVLCVWVVLAPFILFLSISSFALTRGTEWQFLRSSLP